MTVTSLYYPTLAKILFDRLSFGTGFEYHQLHVFTTIVPISMEYYVSSGLSDTRINMSGNSPFQRARVQVCVARARGEDRSRSQSSADLIPLFIRSRAPASHATRISSSG